MTFNDEIVKPKQPIIYQLFEFNLEGVITRYTNKKNGDEVFLGNTYRSVKIETGRANFNTKVEKTTIEIKMALDANNIKYISNSVAADLEVTVTDMIPSVGFCKTAFVGEVIDVTVQNNTAKLVVESSTKVFRDKFPPLVHSAFCNHLVFDGGCKLLELAYETQVTVSGINGNVIEASALASPVFPSPFVPTSGQLDNWFIGGHVKLFDGTDIRLITDYATTKDSITIQFPFDNRVTVGTVLKVYPGCDRSPETCRDKFNNVENFLGFPYIPRQNPVLFSFKS